ncbi:LysR family transcriptional regulator [Caballeronia pedi]|uniref:LysR family transcriptional regulator n=1 Tax=Caballeronia pedi TaxID=1777141 RepID=A0A158BPY5_9BURK|nr:LysR substrate-binding domain-containing protein [Caballeronia pedi]SAK72103.1 LysR family transcriptional regulator [Caballeronia pedi]
MDVAFLSNLLLVVDSGSMAEAARRVGVTPAAIAQQIQAIERDLDVAICLHPAFALPKAYQWHLLREEPIVVLAHSKLAAEEPHELLRREPFIRYDRSLGGGKQADQYLRAAKIVPHELFELNSLMAIAMMVDRGLGVSLAPDIVSPLTTKLAIAKITLPMKTEPRRFGLLWHRTSPRERLIKGILRCAEQVMECA